jgi:hypothetical protein
MAGQKRMIDRPGVQDIARPDLDLLTPLSSRVLFWQPRFVVGSDALHALPYLFWLVETLRPARAVQIGIGDGVSYFGLCQAVDKLGLETMCLGLDWPALDKMGRDKPAPAAIADHQASHYPDISRILAEDPATAHRHLRGGMDLLVINTPLTPALIDTLRKHWQPLLSDSAVLVVLGADLASADAQVRDFLAGFVTGCPVVELDIGGPILTVLLGKDQPDRLTRLAALEPGRPGYAEARQVFARLGTGLRQEQLAKFRTLEVKKAKATLTEMEAEAEDHKARLEATRAERDTALEAEADTAAFAASLQARLFDHDQALAAQAAALAASHTAELEALRAKFTQDLGASEEKRIAHWRSLTSQTDARNAAELQLSQLTTALDKAKTALAAAQAEAKAEADRRIEKAAADNAADNAADIAALTAHLEAARIKTEAQAKAAALAHDAALAAAERAHQTATQHAVQAATHKAAETLAQSKQALQAQIDALLGDIAALTVYFEGQVLEATTQTTARANLAAAQQAAALKAAEKAAKTAAENMGAAKAAALQSQTQIAQLQATLDSQTRALAHLEKRLGLAQEKRISHFKKLELATAHNAALTADLAVAKARIEALLASTSWKVTSPLRKIRGLGQKP